MSDQLLLAIVSPALTLLFSVIGKAIEGRMQPAYVAQQSQGMLMSPPLLGYPGAGYPSPEYGAQTSFPAPATAKVNPGTVLKHIGIIQLVLNLTGFVLGLLLAGPVESGAISVDTFLILVIVLGTIGLIVFFAWFGARVPKAIRWRHLTYVAVGVIVTTLLMNSLLLGVPITAVAIGVACVQTFIAMAIGAGIAGAVSTQ